MNIILIILFIYIILYKVLESYVTCDTIKGSPDRRRSYFFENSPVPS